MPHFGRDAQKQRPNPSPCVTKSAGDGIDDKNYMRQECAKTVGGTHISIGQ